jgi:hypothetical protein
MAKKEQGMSDLRDAARQALEAWEHINLYGFVLADYEGPMEQAITALKTALEQPEQEPVAWLELHALNGELGAALRRLISYCNTLENRLMEADGEHPAVQEAKEAWAKVEGKV